jgi:dihydropyrimidinase
MPISPSGTHKQANDFNIFEGMTVTGVARSTVSQGNLLWHDGDLRAEPGKGRFIERPTFGPAFDAAERMRNQRPWRRVERSEAAE